jgi:hypothetical protein
MINIHNIDSKTRLNNYITSIVITENHLLYNPIEFKGKHTPYREKYYNYYTKHLAHKKVVKDYLDNMADIYIRYGYLDLYGYHAVEKSVGNDMSWIYVIRDALVEVIREKLRRNKK